MNDCALDPRRRAAAAGPEHDIRQIVAACANPTIPVPLQHALANHAEGARRLDRLCATLIAAALRRCGLFVEAGRTLSIDAICHHMSVGSERRPHVQRLVDILLQDQWLSAERDGVRWSGQAAPDDARIAADAAALEADFPCAAGVGRLLLRCTAALPEVIAGRESPVAVLFPSGSVADLQTFYAQFPLLALANAMAAAAAARIARIHGRRDLRVLEVGAGTGALTAALLPVIGDCLHDYVYSDISPTFLDHGRRQFFSLWPALRPLIVDIDKDLAAQGVAAGGRDLVLGCNVVHATPDVRRSIRHLWHALRPGGHLMLVETVLPSRIADCTVGLFDGWWSLRDPELRDGYPLLGVRQWQELLHEEGFHAAAVPVRHHGSDDDDRSTPSPLALLIAVKPAVDNPPWPSRPTISSPRAGC